MEFQPYFHSPTIAIVYILRRISHLASLNPVNLNAYAKHYLRSKYTLVTKKKKEKKIIRYVVVEYKVEELKVVDEKMRLFELMLSLLIHMYSP